MSYKHFFNTPKIKCIISSFSLPKVLNLLFLYIPYLTQWHHPPPCQWIFSSILLPCPPPIPSPEGPVPLLLSLSISGEVSCCPPHPLGCIRPHLPFGDCGYLLSGLLASASALQFAFHPGNPRGPSESQTWPITLLLNTLP